MPLFGPSASLSVSPGVLTTGQTATISYSDPSRAGATIFVDIDDGGRPTAKRDTVKIELDENGEGSTTWDVPDWPVANFNAPDAQGVSRAIVAPNH